jgi:hypothetical protein
MRELGRSPIGEAAFETEVWVLPWRNRTNPVNSSSGADLFELQEA